jgi:hypothetical protein
VLALAARSSGAVLGGLPDRHADLATLPGRVVEVAGRTGAAVGVPRESDWPVLGHDSSAGRGTDELVRAIRQVAASDLR